MVLYFLMIILKWYLNLNIEQNILKILTPKQISQRLPIAVTQVKVGNTSK